MPKAMRVTSKDIVNLEKIIAGLQDVHKTMVEDVIKQRHWILKTKGETQNEPQELANKPKYLKALQTHVRCWSGDKQDGWTLIELQFKKEQLK